MTDPHRLWHVTLTVAGRVHGTEEMCAGLERLGDQQPFLHSIRYRSDRAELQYWEESDGMLDAASLALRLWNEHRASCGLPDWEVVGLEVLERDTFHQRVAQGTGSAVGTPSPTPRPY